MRCAGRTADLDYRTLANDEGRPKPAGRRVSRPDAGVDASAPRAPPDARSDGFRGGSDARDAFADAPTNAAPDSAVPDDGAPEALGPPNEDGVRVAPGFSARVIARTGHAPLAGSDFVWHGAPDGGAVFGLEDGGWIYVSNSELPFVDDASAGGVSALRFDARGELVDAYPILRGTDMNCAGGATPWGTWLSCEEVARGRVYECDPFGVESAIERPALGLFRHEAAAVDPVQHHVYLTEDEPAGRFYRFVPERLTADGHADLSSGQLEVACVAKDNTVTWKRLLDPSGADTPTSFQIPESTPFNGGEGIWYQEGIVYFATKGDDRIWAYDTRTSRLRILFDYATSNTTILHGVDNLSASPAGDLFVAEDALIPSSRDEDMQVVVITKAGRIKPVVQIDGHYGSEVTGPALTPGGNKLYFSSQRGAANDAYGGGVTYEVTGPFFS